MSQITPNVDTTECKGWSVGPHVSRVRPTLRLISTLAMTLIALAGAKMDAISVPHVTTTTPVRNDLDVPKDLSQIWAFFNGPLAPLPEGCVRVSGTLSGLHEGQVQLADNVIIFQNGTEPFLPGELVVVNYRSDIEDVGGSPLAGGFGFSFTIASGQAGPSWSAPLTFETASIPYFIYGGDVDEDNRPDVVTPNEGTNDVSVFLNHYGLGTFPIHSEFAVGARPSSIFGEDFDNDGDQDLATADINGGTVSVLLNNGDGTFAPRQEYQAGLQCRQIHGGDFDGDNDVDLCATAHQSNLLLVYFNNGDGTFTPAPPITTISAGPFAIRTGDFDGDGHLDIGVACQDTDVLNVFTNGGGGNFVRTGIYAVGNGPWCLNGNDMDGDGDFDLVSVASFENRLIVLFNDGAGGFPTRFTASTQSFPLGVFASDLDGDGDIDVTSSNYSGQSVGVYLNPGNGQVALQSTLPTQSSASYTWAHDLDGDGDLDLSVADEEADLLFIFYNGSHPAATQDPAAPIPPSTHVQLRLEPNPIDPGNPAVVTLAGFRGPTDLELVESSGRRLATIWKGVTTGSAQRILWPGRAASGAPLAAGGYFLVARSSDGSDMARRVIVLPR
jgi:hypothetical protein